MCLPSGVLASPCRTVSVPNTAMIQRPVMIMARKLSARTTLVRDIWAPAMPAAAHTPKSPRPMNMTKAWTSESMGEALLDGRAAMSSVRWMKKMTQANTLDHTARMKGRTQRRKAEAQMFMASSSSTCSSVLSNLKNASASSSVSTPSKASKSRKLVMFSGSREKLHSILT